MNEMRDDQPAMTAATDSAPDGTVQVQIGRPHILRLRPPVDTRTLEHTLHDIRMDRLIRRLPSDLTVTVEDGDIVLVEGEE